MSTQCNESQNPTTYENKTSLSRSIDILDALLESDPLVQELIDIRSSITERINRRLNIDFSLEDLKQAYKNSDSAKVYLYMGLSSEKVEKLSERLQTLTETLFTKYPEINSFIDTLKKCNECQVDLFFSHYYEFTDPSQFSMKRLAKLTCRWGPYIGALVVCSTLGPFFYWPCAYVAMCSFCSGGITEDICYLLIKEESINILNISTAFDKNSKSSIKNNMRC